MAHSESLRVIGQLLEAAKIPAFQLEEDGVDYVVKSNSLPQTDEWVLRHALIRKDFTHQTTGESKTPCSIRFSRSDIYRLDDQAQLQRRRKYSPPNASKLSQQLRTIGHHLDRMNARACQISWGSDSVTVYFRRLNGQRDSITFTLDNLQRLGASPSLRQSNPD